MMPPILSNFIGWCLKQTWSTGCAVAASPSFGPCSSAGVGEAPALIPIVGGPWCGVVMEAEVEPKDGAVAYMVRWGTHYVYVYEREKRRWFSRGPEVHEEACRGK